MTEGFDTRTTALLQNLASEEIARLAQRFAPGHVVIQVGADALTRPQGQLLVSMAVNVAARLFPVVQCVSVVLPGDYPLLFSPPRWAHGMLVGHLQMLLQSLPKLVRWSIVGDRPTSYDVALVVGAGVNNVGLHSVFIGANGWEVSFSSDRAVPTGENTNPVGAYAAACLAIAEVWKRLLVPHRDVLTKAFIRPQIESLEFSALTYLSSSGPNPELPSTVEVSRVTVIGVGAGGGAAAFTLASLGDVQGHLNLIDPDEIEGSNLNRYVMADAIDAAKKSKKATLAAGMFARKKVTVTPYPHALSECEGLRPADYVRVLAAVHTREARREIQWETPSVLWDAGATQEGDFRIWRMVMGQTECMHCKHPPSGEDVEYQKAAQLAKLLKFEQALCLRKIRDNEIFADEEITALTNLVQDEGPAFDPPKPNQRFGDWEAEQCGKLKLPELDEEVPIPFAPVLAGVLIAGEIIKEQHFREYVLDSRYSNTVMGQFMRRSRPVHRPPRSDCKLCNDPVMREQFEKRARSAPAEQHPGLDLSGDLLNEVL